MMFPELEMEKHKTKWWDKVRLIFYPRKTIVTCYEGNIMLMFYKIMKGRIYVLEIRNMTKLDIPEPIPQKYPVH